MYENFYKDKDKSNKKVIGKTKVETKGVPVVEFVGLKSKMYSFIRKVWLRRQ